MKRFLLPWLSIAAACSFLTSCFQNEITVRLNKDGSGTLIEETSFGAKAVEMFTQFAQMGGGAAKDPLAELASEENAKARAAKIGEGVTLEKVEATSKDGGKGAKLTYHFTDINKIKVIPNDGLQKAMPQMPGQPAPEESKNAPITFKYVGDKLTVQLPEPKKMDNAGKDAPATPQLDAEQEKQMKEMFNGMKMTVKLVIEPGISSSTASHVDGNTVTLVDMDFGKMMAEPGAMQKMAALGKSDPNDAMEEMKKFDGVKIETKREVEISVK